MRLRPIRSILLLVCLSLAATNLAQEGHPLTGTWTGAWGAAKKPLTLVMNWDGKKVDAILNPGPDSMPVAVQLNVDSWSVRFEANSKRISAEGRLEDLGSYHRRITGSWTEDGAKGDFKLTRE